MNWQSYLSPEALDATCQWSRPCEEVFNRLAHWYPNDLLRLVKSKTLNNAQLTFAAESLGNVIYDDHSPHLYEDAKTCLLELARHENSPMVQEGALYGLSNMGAECRLLLQNLAQHAKSQTIKDLCKEMLNNGL